MMDYFLLQRLFHGSSLNLFVVSLYKIALPQCVTFFHSHNQGHPNKTLYQIIAGIPPQHLPIKSDKFYLLFMLNIYNTIREIIFELIEMNLVGT